MEGKRYLGKFLSHLLMTKLPFKQKHDGPTRVYESMKLLKDGTEKTLLDRIECVALSATGFRQLSIKKDCWQTVCASICLFWKPTADNWQQNSSMSMFLRFLCQYIYYILRIIYLWLCDGMFYLYLIFNKKPTVYDRDRVEGMGSASSQCGLPLFFFCHFWAQWEHMIK